MKCRPTFARVSEVLRYDPINGTFHWLERPELDQNWNAKFAGNLAGYINKGRRLIRIDGTQYFASQIAWLLMTGLWPVKLVDHRNRIKCDDRWDNLREATNSQNNYNTSPRSNSKSGVKGVGWVAALGKWKAQIKVSGRNIHVGVYDSLEEARSAYREAALHHHRDFAYTD